MDKTTDRWMWAGALPAAFAVGLLISWYVNLPPTPWMQFTELSATYVLGSEVIQTSGKYEVNEPCLPEMDEDGTPRDRVVWRIEAIATDGQIAEYGPKKPMPSLSEGEHVYDGSIPLEAEIYPDGWEVRILVTCRDRTPETVGISTLVSIDTGVAPHPP